MNTFADILIPDKIIVEIKAAKNIAEEHEDTIIKLFKSN